MERLITQFIRALRSADVRVSTSESLDAVRTVELIGFADRAALKDSLGCVLAKSPEEKKTFDGLFELYFSRAPATATAASDRSDGAQDLADLLASGDEAAITLAVEQAGAAAGVSDIRFSTQVAYYAQSMMREMGGEGLQTRLIDALQGASADDAAEAQRLIDLRAGLLQRTRAHATRAFDVFGASETQKFRDDFASEKRLNALDAHDMARLKGLIAKMARRLAIRHARRRRKAQRGTLDVRRTLRSNAGLGGVPFNVSWRRKKRDRPKLAVVCDVSGSVASYVRFLLLLLWSMRDAIPDVKAYAFSHRLAAVDDLLGTHDFDTAMTKILREYGMGSTSYGQAWSDLTLNHESDIDRRTTLIVLGDARSNYGDPRLDLFRGLAGRAKRVIWLNPEGRGLWGTGDSVMPRYAPLCAEVCHVATLKDFERIVDDVLSRYD
jgi:uncharacterized protein